MRIFSASLATETNTFAPMPTGLSSFHDRGYFAAGQHPDQMTFFSGPLWAARLRGAPLGWTLIEGMVAGAQPSGTTTRHAYETLRDELLADLRAALPVDVVLLGLHGAMVADGYADCEGDLLTRVRALVGPGVVVGAELDLHCHLTEAMVAQADYLIAFKEYPHTDILERGLELVDLCVAQAEGGVRAHAALHDCRMVVTMHTPREPARGFVARMQALEGKDGVRSISLAHGFPWGDVPGMGTKVLVYTDAAVDPEGAQARALARRLGDELFAMRMQFAAPSPGIDAALDQALAGVHASPGLNEKGPAVLADGADNPGGGAAGDSTFILRRLVERGITNSALGPLWDPQAVRISMDAGVGATLPLRLGGKISPLSGDPLDAVCRVMGLQTDLVMTGLSGTPTLMGDCAWVRVLTAQASEAEGSELNGGEERRDEEKGDEKKGVDVILISLRNQAFHPDLFTQLGCDVAARRIVVVKSSQHFYAAFAPLASQVIYVQAPGAVTHDWAGLPYRHVQRPKWPLDPVDQGEPV